MRLKTTGLALCASILSMAAAAGSAQAAGGEPEALNRYLVSGKVTADQLARAGYDLHESGAPLGKRSIIATASQARALRDQGATVEPTQRLAQAEAAAPENPLTQPTYGYNVFRPWSLEPAACPQTCSTPNVPLKEWYAGQAKKYKDIVKEVVIGKTIRGQDIMAYKVTSYARIVPDGARPVTMYESTQHAREWISAETNRRLFSWFLENRMKPQVRDLLRANELWFIPVMNPDGYDYTFTTKANRLWRKNLRDVNGDGRIMAGDDGVDLNRNWPEKWNYDLEGASKEPASETYHGTAAASEPEVTAARRLQQRLRPRFLIDYHSYGPLILYPEGWQVETEATDGPLLRALAGTDDKPAIAGYDPDVAAELYITNGDVTGDALNAWGTQAYTVELDAGSGPGVGGTVESEEGSKPEGFVFQDDEAAVQAVFEKNLEFALDLARSAARPDAAKPHTGERVPDLVPSTFSLSTADPQVIEVNAKRSLGRITAYWRVNGGKVNRGATYEWNGGEKYGEPGRYFHRLRGTVRGTKPGDRVEVWFGRPALPGKASIRSASFTYSVKSDTAADVLLLTAEDYTGRVARDVADDEGYAGPRYEDDYAAALTAAGITFDTYDVDANGRKAPSSLGILKHYKAVVWQTGDDWFPVEPGQPDGTGTSKLMDDELIAVRDYLNEGGKLLLAGRSALSAGWNELLFNPLAAPPAPFCPSDTTTGADAPEGQVANCVPVSNDFLQYWLGAYLNIRSATGNEEVAALPFAESGGPFGDLVFGLNGEDSAKNHDKVDSFLTTSSVLPEAEYPQFASRQAVKLDRPQAFEPPTGEQYAFSQTADDAYKRLSRTVDLTGRTSADLSFKASFDTEAGWDFVFVEARTVGSDDWTTLPDVGGLTSDDTGDSCTEIPTVEEHPFLAHYLTYTPGPDGSTTGSSCAPTGSTGTWNALSGNSGGVQELEFDLSAYAGKQVEVSITSMSDLGFQGLGVFLDDAKITADGATLTETSFEDGLGGWETPGAPEGSAGNANDWIASPSVGYVEGPGVATADTILWGFGLEGVTGAANRAKLIGDALRSLGVGVGAG